MGKAFSEWEKRCHEHFSGDASRVYCTNYIDGAIDDGQSNPLSCLSVVQLLHEEGIQ